MCDGMETGRKVLQCSCGRDVMQWEGEERALQPTGGWIYAGPGA